MSGTLVVHLNRGSLHDVEPEATTFEVTGSFEVELRNHGPAVHVYLQVDETLGESVSLSETNHFVESETTEIVPVRVKESWPTTGHLEVVSGYGNTEEVIEITVADPDGEGSVQVDASLGRPQPRPAESPLPAILTRPGTLRVGGLAALALSLAILAITVAPSAIVAFGALVVLFGIGVAGYLLVRPVLL